MAGWVCAGTASPMTATADMRASLTVDFAPDVWVELEALAELHTGGDVGRFLVLLAIREVRPAQFAEMMADHISNPTDGRQPTKETTHD